LTTALLVAGIAIYLRFAQTAPETTLQTAEHAIARRDFTSAGRHLAACLKARPEDPALRLLAARTARRQGDFMTASEHLELYRLQAGVDDEYDFERQLLRLQQGDLAEIDVLLASCTQRPDASQTPLRLEAAIEGSLSALWRDLQQEQRGKGELRAADYASAQKAVDLWFVVCPGSVDQVQGFVWRGKLLSLAREHVRAQEALRRAVELDPQHMVARELLGISLMRDAPGEAASHLEMVHQRDPENVRVTYLLATVRRGLGQLDVAGTLFDEVLSAQPGNVDALVERGRVAVDEGRPHDAERWLRAAVERAPDYAPANRALGQCLEQLDRSGDATEYLQKALRSDAQQRKSNQATQRP
jgi:predicted Zn-dependent protease